MGPDTLTTTRESQTFSSVTPPWEMVRAPIYESGACSFRVAGVRSVLGAVLRQLQSALLVFGKVVLGTISHPLGEKKSVRLAARQLNAFRRVSEMGIKPMNSAAWRAGAPPTGMCRHRRACHFSLFEKQVGIERRRHVFLDPIRRTTLIELDQKLLGGRLRTYR